MARLRWCLQERTEKRFKGSFNFKIDFIPKKSLVTKSLKFEISTPFMLFNRLTVTKQEG